MSRSPVLFRVDADTIAGHESMSRCMVLAAALQRRRRQAYFLSRVEPASQILPLKRGGNEYIAAGAFALVLECVPSEIAAAVTERVGIPTIGIGAGPDTDAQVIVWQDLVGLTPGPAPKFVKQYADVRTVIADAVGQWGADVASGAYPAAEHAYS